jgi:hypothetical protein
MRLHTKLGGESIARALQQAKSKGRVGRMIVFAVDDEHGSRTHPRAFEIRLGSWDSWLPAGTRDQHGKRTLTRRRRGGEANHGDYPYAATWHEWGWLMAEIWDMDPTARWGGTTGWHYKDRADFDAKTDGAFISEFLRLTAEQHAANAARVKEIEAGE